MTRNNGFTLVELLIVVIILAILAAIVVPQFSASTDDAKRASLQSTLAGIRSAIDLYYQQHGAYPGENDATGGAACVAGTAGIGDASTAAERAEAFIDQLTKYTAANGTSCSQQNAGAYSLGPYLKKPTLPNDPFTGKGAALAELTVVNTGDLAMDAAGITAGGWRYDTKTGKFIMNHEDYDDL